MCKDCLNMTCGIMYSLLTPASAYLVGVHIVTDVHVYFRFKRLQHRDRPDPCSKYNGARLVNCPHCGLHICLQKPKRYVRFDL